MAREKDFIVHGTHEVQEKKEMIHMLKGSWKRAKELTVYIYIYRAIGKEWEVGEVLESYNY